MKCPECGEEVSVASGYCPNCGQPFEYDIHKADTGEFSSKIDQIRENSKSRRTTIRNLVLIAAVFAAIVGAIWYVTYNVGIKVDDADQFPDAALRTYIGNQFDTDGNGTISNGELKAVTYFGEIEGSGIKSLEGLEVFENLETIDVSNSEVETLFSPTKKNSLPNLTTLILNGSQIKNFVAPYYCESLTEVYCSGTGLESVEIGEKSSIRLFDCSHNVLNELDLTDAKALRDLNCSFNSLTRMNLPSQLTDLNCSDNNLEFVHFDQGNNVITLESLYCQNNQMVGMLSGGSWSNNLIYIADEAKCDISNNPSLWIDRYDDGRVFVNCQYSSIGSWGLVSDRTWPDEWVEWALS